MAEDGNEASFVSGMLLQFVNPKIYIYAIPAMSLYVLPVYQSVVALVAFTLVLTLIGSSGSFMWALFSSAFCRFFSRHARAANFVMALFPAGEARLGGRLKRSATKRIRVSLALPVTVARKNRRVLPDLSFL
ncbi:MAG: hypothetical protein NC211_00850 [Alistipes senegalensis]|nr:hypothetical protein [Oxalobacter formigenes]MCM1280373.1 hypothetical protein [Alistipes senegalensis]